MTFISRPIFFFFTIIFLSTPIWCIPRLPTSVRKGVTSQTACESLPVLVCNVVPTEGNSARGTVYFSPIWTDHPDKKGLQACFTRIRAAMSGLEDGKHGFHVHSYGDLSGEDGKSTGGHFSDPAGSELQHGMPDDTERHWGDLGNINSDSGVAEYDEIDYIVRLGGVVGRAMTLHESFDHGSEEQPSGNAGSRVAYGVIGYANPELLQI